MSDRCFIFSFEVADRNGSAEPVLGSFTAATLPDALALWQQHMRKTCNLGRDEARLLSVRTVDATGHTGSSWTARELGAAARIAAIREDDDTPPPQQVEMAL